jgi:hypothetical protein
LSFISSFARCKGNKNKMNCYGKEELCNQTSVLEICKKKFVFNNTKFLTGSMSFWTLHMNPIRNLSLPTTTHQSTNYCITIWLFILNIGCHLKAFWKHFVVIYTYICKQFKFFNFYLKFKISTR